MDLVKYRVNDESHTSKSLSIILKVDIKAVAVAGYFFWGGAKFIYTTFSGG